MARLSCLKVCAVLILSTLSITSAFAQAGKGTISGRAVDTAGGILPGAQVELQPRGSSSVTNDQGDFTLSNLAPGSYTVTVSYVGFAPFTSKVTLEPGQLARIDAVLKVASKNEEVTVIADRPHGEAEAINRQRTSDNILQVLPSDVITALPNANIADAVGRLPSVTLERDEGEGKYVQIRGTEPRLNNVTIDGITIPAPENSVRQVKLDTIPADIVESVEVNKTLSANQDAEAIGGSVNLVTKTAGDSPTISINGIGGYTPILGGRGADQFGVTVGQRFGAQKKLGVLFGGTYDYNGRGINDIEPSPTAGSASPHYDSIDLRDYKYYRTREGFAGSTDYKLGPDSGLYARTFYSTFQDYGEKTVYTLNDGSDPSLSQDWRRPNYAVGSLVAGGHHVFSTSWLSWDLSVARSRTLSGSGGADYGWNGGNSNCTDSPATTTDVYRPQFSASCFTPGATNALSPANYTLTDFQLPTAAKPFNSTCRARLRMRKPTMWARTSELSSSVARFATRTVRRPGLPSNLDSKWDDCGQPVRLRFYNSNYYNNS